jgi:hypothetical protein
MMGLQRHEIEQLVKSKLQTIKQPTSHSNIPITYGELARVVDELVAGIVEAIDQNNAQISGRLRSAPRNERGIVLLEK